MLPAFLFLFLFSQTNVYSTSFFLRSRNVFSRRALHLQQSSIVQHQTPTKTIHRNVTVHSYSQSGQTWKGLNCTKSKFLAYLTFCNVSTGVDRINTQSYCLAEEEDEEERSLREEWRSLWKDARLLTGRTEILTVYPSDAALRARKRGSFSDLLHLYTERLIGILRDEQEPGQLKLWLQEHYGVEPTNQIVAHQLRQLPIQEQKDNLKHFLEYFRSSFPYYYDRCGACGASMREDDHVICGSEDDEEDDTSTFIGYIFPTREELIGKASRTELYQCHVCEQFTRFPRFNSAKHVLEHGRGRCGEYSMLLFCFLRALGHDCRWVVDWADHVWVEVNIQGTWIHLDPCEAAVDHNLLYQEWGKKQTYILAFYAPDTHDSGPLIEDVTKSYTSDTWDDINQRRDESPQDVQTSIQNAIQRLETRLRNQTTTT
jgi:hypothetical protein